MCGFPLQGQNKIKILSCLSIYLHSKFWIWAIQMKFFLKKKKKFLCKSPFFFFHGLTKVWRSFSILTEHTHFPFSPQFTTLCLCCFKWFSFVAYINNFQQWSWKLLLPLEKEMCLAGVHPHPHWVKCPCYNGGRTLERGGNKEQKIQAGR